MKEKNFLKRLEQALKKRANVKYKEGAEKFFKEKVLYIGVKTPVVRGISSLFYNEIKLLNKEEIFRICKTLIKKENEYQTIALSWLFRTKKFFEKKDFSYFEKLVKENVSNWATCDDFCCHALGYFLYIFPEFLPKVFEWTKSRSRWVRRASAVSLLYSIRRDQSIKQAFAMADALLLDTDDMAQKGYGWMLKEISGKKPSLVFEYVMKNKLKMPRTALRYAIEKLPKEMKKKAMEK